LLRYTVLGHAMSKLLWMLANWPWSPLSIVPCSLLQQKYGQNDCELLAALHCKV
jgi:hypothetical protein